MGRAQRTLERLLRGQSDANVEFADLTALLQALGFEERVRGSHHIFVRPGIDELLNLQRDGSKAKVYQVRQVRAVILKYNFALEP
jgi:hypothetical protein